MGLACPGLVWLGLAGAAGSAGLAGCVGWTALTWLRLSCFAIIVKKSLNRNQWKNDDAVAVTVA